MNVDSLAYLPGIWPEANTTSSNSSTKGSRDVIVITSAVVGSTVVFLLVLFLLVLLFCWHRARLRRQIRRLVGDLSSNNSYGSGGTSSLSIDVSHRHSRRYSSFGIRRPPIFILYALELGNFHKIRREDYPTYSLVLELTNVLYALDLPCYHDGSDSFQNDSIQDFPSKVYRAVREAKAVVVLCSEVLSTAFHEAKSNKRKAQMKFGVFSVLRVKKIMDMCEGKFVPVTLTGASSVCPELQGKHCFNLQNYGQFLSTARGSVNSVGVQKNDPQFSEFSELATELKQLLYCCE